MVVEQNGREYTTESTNERKNIVMDYKSLLEAVMLICFGFSWPLNLIKNIKAGTAKAMSLPFIVLILFGYIAGIAAKFVGYFVQGIALNYVLIVYFLNLIFVSINFVVYFINKGKDKKRDAEAAAAAAKKE